MAFFKQMITFWSYSRYTTYEPSVGGCPAKAKYKFLDKIKEPGSAAMDRGSAIHTEAEEFVKGTEKTLSPNLEKIADQVSYLKKMKASAEETWAYRKDWSRTTYDDWANCWLRIKVDAALVTDKGRHMDIVDYKTGKERGGYEAQLELYAVGGFQLFPNVREITTRLLYTDTGSDIPVVYKREQFPELKAGWEERVRPMLTDARFAPTPSHNACRFCFYRKDNNGPCKY
jgi:RecB family exonuclease